MKKRILFVDDEPLVLESLKRLLRGQRDVWEMVFLDNPTLACDELLHRSYDAVVSDVRMPEITGLQLVQRIQQTKTNADTPVIILTGQSDRGLKRQALDLGAADLLNKPVQREDLLARLRSALRLKESLDSLKLHNEQLESAVQERTLELASSRIEIIWRLGKAAEYRDEETGNHVVRVGCYSRAIAETLGLDREFVNQLFLAAPLHDVGKIGIPDRILLKKGKLDDMEWSIMCRHCRIGAEILECDGKIKKAFAAFGGSWTRSSVREIVNPALKMASLIALTHHERFDGTGYPQCLAGADIPLASRIVTIADVYDALRSKRPYKEPYSLERSLDILAENAGAQFDPEIHAAFMDTLDTIRAIELELSDDQEVAMTVGADHVQNLIC